MWKRICITESLAVYQNNNIMNQIQLKKKKKKDSLIAPSLLEPKVVTAVFRDLSLQ